MRNNFEVDKFTDEWRDLLDTLDQVDRERHAVKVADKISEYLKLQNIETARQTDEKPKSFYTDFVANGISDLGLVLNPAEVKTIRSHFDKQPSYNAHVYAQSDQIARNGVDESGDFASFRLADIVTAPHIIELANHPRMISLAERHLGCVPTIYSINCWWSFPAEMDKMRTTQSFHRDVDDYRFMSLFVYLTDVDDNSGPHQYVAGSHTVAGLEDLVANSFVSDDLLDREFIKQSEPFKAVLKILSSGESYLVADHLLEIFGNNFNTFTGVKGTGLMSNPAGFHRGLTPRDRPRLMLWVRYGMFYNWAAARDLIEPIHLSDVDSRLIVDEKSKYMNRLILNFD